MNASQIQVTAAQYLRVSTETQQYSLNRQSDCIGQYAAEHGFPIVQTYVDRAKSGLLLRNRAGLKQLLADVTTGRAGYRVVLVYDVTRWGRFQDVDEAGHYEFVCKQCGIPVHYCAEVFDNDETPVNFIMKTLKRTMAGEYSRELGIRCFAGQKRIAQLGFRAGGAAGYGYRRMLVAPDRRVKQQLGLKDRKSIATDRVILVPGPENEVACVRQMYRMLIDREMSFCAIARELNREGVQCGSTAWTHHRVRSILTNSKYNGTIVYGRVSKRLQTPQIRMPADSWVVVPHAFEPIIDDATYIAAQASLAGRTGHKTDVQLLDELRSILRARGKLTARLIRNTQGATPSRSYRQRFGSLGNAYELIGYQMPVSQNIRTRCLIYQARRCLIQELQELFPETISVEGRKGSFPKWVQLKDGTRIIVRTCPSFRTERGGLRWRVLSDPGDSHFTALLVLMNPGNDAVGQLVLLPPVARQQRINISVNSDLLRLGRPISSLGLFLEVAARINHRRTDGTAKSA